MGGGGASETPTNVAGAELLPPALPSLSLSRVEHTQTWWPLSARLFSSQERILFLCLVLSERNGLPSMQEVSSFLHWSVSSLSIRCCPHFIGAYLPMQQQRHSWSQPMA